MPGTKILWGQIIAVFALVLVGIWSATQWTAHALAYQSELGQPWFTVGNWPIYPPPAFFWWWFSFDAYAPQIFQHGAYIAVAGGFAAILLVQRRACRNDYRVLGISCIFQWVGWLNPVAEIPRRGNRDILHMMRAAPHFALKHPDTTISNPTDLHNIIYYNYLLADFPIKAAIQSQIYS